MPDLTHITGALLGSRVQGEHAPEHFDRDPEMFRTKLNSTVPATAEGVCQMLDAGVNVGLLCAALEPQHARQARSVYMDILSKARHSFDARRAVIEAKYKQQLAELACDELLEKAETAEAGLALRRGLESSVDAIHAELSETLVLLEQAAYREWAEIFMPLWQEVVRVETARQAAK